MLRLYMYINIYIYIVNRFIGKRVLGLESTTFHGSQHWIWAGSVDILYQLPPNSFGIQNVSLR